MSRRNVLLLVTAVPVVAAVAILLATLPPVAVPLDDSAWKAGPKPVVVAGAIHVHTNRSDGAGTMDEVAAAAARAGLQFVVFGDHGDAMRTPEPPVYRHGVLCLDGVEISSSGGHYLALDMPAAPYPLAGEPRDIVEDVRRLGGFGIVAHPTSAKRALQWTDWAAPFDGLEWLNADAEWRDERWPSLSRLPFVYLIRPAAALASLLDRPELALARWDALTARRRVVALAAADAHGRIDIGGDSSGERTLSPLRVPSYVASFRTFAVRAELDRPLAERQTAPRVSSADGAADARLVWEALRGGRVFSGIDALATPVRFEFTATSGDRVARMGQTVMPTGPVGLRARTVLPPGGELVLFQDGQVARTSTSDELRFETEAATGVFRIEVRLAGAPGTPPIPWIVSNPIYVGPRSGEGETPPPRLQAVRTTSLYADGDGGGWVVEKDSESRAAVSSTPTVDGRELAFRYALRGAPVEGQYAALSYRFEREEDVGTVARFDRLMFRARSSRPMRLEVQIRQPGGPDGQRWQRSVYLDETPRDLVVFFDDMGPIGRTGRRRADRAAVTAILFVVDTNHTLPATAGIVWLDDVRLGGR